MRRREETTGKKQQMEHPPYRSSHGHSLTDAGKSSCLGTSSASSFYSTSHYRDFGLRFSSVGDSMQSEFSGSRYRVAPSGIDTPPFLHGKGYLFSDTLAITKTDSSKYLSGSSILSSNYSSGIVSTPLQQPQWPPTAQSLLTLAGSKRPNEEVLQAISGIPSQNNAVSSANGLATRPRVDSMASLPTYPQRLNEKYCAHYMITRTCKFGANCKFHHPTWVPAGGIPDWKEGSNADPPERAGEPVCTHYLRSGICNFGSNHHPKDHLGAKDEGNMVGHPKATNESQNIVGQKVNKVVTNVESKEGQGASTAGHGNSESNVITFKPAIGLNSKGLPIRPGQQDCSFFVKTGSCKYGALCIFNHPESNGVNTPTTVTSFLSSSALPSVTPNQPSTAVPGSLPQQVIGASVFAQRPGQEECAHYMRTGKCDYGPACKFHHPLDRQRTSVKLTLAGLPRRMGEEPCKSYVKTGTCKFGVNCKFDHPPPGELAAAMIANTTAPKLATGNDESNVA
eukprot:TRINITY_DN15339_c0_g1_i1.p1 TRINITY_DN15339_c0_g1~~TRINITY_DN15339_c0_g1_i1.p1  ORF type:complete len:509 (+),score=86.52 TRINITY_DN15339_c0_g1_i1:182-1708(+)